MLLTSLLATIPAQAQEPAFVRSGAVPAEPHCLLILTQDLSLGALEHPREQVFGSIHSHAVAPDGTLFVLDFSARRVVVFGAEGEFIRFIGRRGMGPGEFEGPTRLAVGVDQLLVYDQQLGRVTSFDLDGRHLATATLPFRTLAPPFLAILPDGGFVLTGATEPGGPVIHLFSSDLRHVRSWGSGPEWLDEMSYRYLATGPVDVDAEGRIWFAPTGDYQLLRYRQDGTLERRITRDHSFPFNPRPYVSFEDVGGGRQRFAVDQERAFVVRIQLDRTGRIWVFVRDRPANRIVIDVFSAEGRFLQSHPLPLDGTPVASRDSRGFFYRVTSEEGIPRIHRFRGELRATGTSEGVSC